jgi:hypothetical protein
MGDRIEEQMRDLLLASVDLSELQVVYRGDPFLVPVSLHPFGYVFLTDESPASSGDGYGALTGPTSFWKYEGIVQIEVVQRDALQLTPDAGRRADVPSYLKSRELIAAARMAVYAWGGPGQLPETNRIESIDGKESTLELRIGGTQNGVLARGDNVTNVGVFSWTVFTRREEF